MDLQALLPNVVQILEQAAQAVIEIRDSKADLQESWKNENGYESVFTIADLTSDRIIYNGLSQLTPGIPVITEENVYDEIMKHDRDDLKNGYFWIIDPIDGTRHFKEGRDTWLILAALIHNRRPVLSVVYRPAGETRLGYYAIKGHGAYKFTDALENVERIRVNTTPSHEINAMIEIPYAPAERLLDIFKTVAIKNRTQIETDEKNGFSDANAFFDCLLAEGKIDFITSPCDNRGGGEWDIAAPSLIVEEAGGYFRDFDNQPLLFGTPDIKVKPSMSYARPALYEEYTEEFFKRYVFENGVFTKKTCT